MEYKRTPSVITWLIPRVAVPFMRRTQDMPSVVTWFLIPKTSDADIEFNPSPSDLCDNGVEQTQEDDPFGRLYSPLRGDDPLHRTLSADDNDESVQAPSEEINALAAVKIQSATRGMVDRKFFRQLLWQSQQRRYSSAGLTLTSSPSKKSFKTKAKRSWMEPDGYLSSITEKKIKERGAPLARHKVEEKYNALIRTKLQATLSVTCPSAEDNTWEAGESKTIKWACSGTVKVLKVGLFLYRDGEPIHLIISGSRNAGKYIFTMPENFKPAGGYQVLVMAEEPASAAAHAFSAPFTIVRRRLGLATRRPAPLPTIALTFPVRPLWRWVCGAAHKVSWTSSCGVHAVTVDLVRHGDRPALRVATAIINVGAVDFAMPLAAPTGDGFQLRVRSVTNPAVEGLSIPFSIVDRQAALAVPRFSTPARPRRPASPGEARVVDRALRALDPGSPYAARAGSPGGRAAASKLRQSQTGGGGGGGGMDGSGTLHDIVERDRPAPRRPAGAGPAGADPGQDSPDEDFGFQAAYAARVRSASPGAAAGGGLEPGSGSRAGLDRFRLPRIGHSLKVQAALTPVGPPPGARAPSSRASKRSRHGGPGAAGGGGGWARTPWWQAMLAEGRVRPDAGAGAAGRAVSGAEDFLERRDRVFAEQLLALRGPAGGGGDDASSGAGGGPGGAEAPGWARFASGNAETARLERAAQEHAFRAAATVEVRVGAAGLASAAPA